MMIKPLSILLILTLLCCSPRKNDGGQNNNIQVAGLSDFSMESIDPSSVKKRKEKTSVSCSSCTHIIPSNKYWVDGDKMNIKPGDVICFSPDNTYGGVAVHFININGTAEKPVLITNCDGRVEVRVEKHRGFVAMIDQSKHFRISGAGAEGIDHGISFSGSSSSGLLIGDMCTDFEVDHVEVFDTGFAGIMAKTNVRCDPATQRGNFTMKNISIHHTYIHETGGEGFYIGNTGYLKPAVADCGEMYVHDIHGAKIYNNVLKNTGWDGIQLSSATKGAEIYGNVVENYGTKNERHQNSGIAIGEGTGGLCYNNFVKKGTGNGIVVVGYGDNVVFNNIIVDAGDLGIFCDERFTPGTGFKFFNNTIINPANDGIRVFAEKLPDNAIINNIIVAKNEVYIGKFNEQVKIATSNNFFTDDIGELKFKDPEKDDYTPGKNSPVINSGMDVSMYNISFDFYHKPRPQGKGYDIGAVEFSTERDAKD